MKILLYTKDEKILKKYTKMFFKLKYTFDSVNDEEKILHYNSKLIILHLDYLLDSKDIINKIRLSNDRAYILGIYNNLSFENRINKYYQGIDDLYNQKLGIDELGFKIKAIEKIINRYSYNTDNIFKIDNLVLNIDTREVKRGNIEIKLTNKEFLLLEYFLKNKNKLLSRDKIIQNIWNFGYGFNSNIVDVYINNLRKKINKDNSVKLINTIRGAGYILKN
ncbi:response regulator transcription factor [Oceanivirga salmonicida]|uniref:response regulator transcription factor n=1 Tax=Oceanivirga salmonicida TaxID=1769291 RepID=UPI0008371B7A|nr:response regulator transcription factor [Oceanivirga salmonicida]